MTPHPNFDVMIEPILKAMAKSGRNYKRTDWFFPSDIRPHSLTFRRLCNQLWKRGVLDRSEKNNRYGYRYKIADQLEHAVKTGEVK